MGGFVPDSAPTGTGFVPDKYQREAPDDKTALGDIGRSVLSGIEQLPGMATGLVDIPFALAANVRPADTAANWVGEKTGFQPGKWAKEQQYSTGYNASQAEVADAWKGANVDPAASLTDQFLAVIKASPRLAAAYAANPMYTLNQVAESAPSMLAGGLASRGMLAAGSKVVGKAAGSVGPALPGLAERTLGSWAVPVAGGAGEGLVQAGQAMDGSDKAIDARHAAVGALGSGAIDMLIGAGAGRAAHALGLETAETALAGGRRGLDTTPMTWGQRVAAMAKGGVSEGVLQELPQSAQEQVWQNYSEGKPLMEGVERAGIEGMLSGMVMGAGANMLGGRDKAIEAPLPVGPNEQSQHSLIDSATPPAQAPAADTSSGVLTASSLMGMDPHDAAGVLQQLQPDHANGMLSELAQVDPAHHDEVQKAMQVQQQDQATLAQQQRDQAAAQAAAQAAKDQADAEAGATQVEHTLRRYGEHTPVDPNAPDAHHTFDGEVHNTLPLTEQAIKNRVLEDMTRVAEQAKQTGVPAEVIHETEGAFGAAFRATEAAKELAATAEKPYEAKPVKFTHDLLTSILAGATSMADVTKNIAVRLAATTGTKKADFETRALLQRMQNVLATPLGEDHSGTIDNNVGPLAPPPKPAKGTTADKGAAPAATGATNAPAAPAVPATTAKAGKKSKQSAPASGATEGTVAAPERVKTKTEIGHENTIEKFKMLIDCLKGKA